MIMAWRGHPCHPRAEVKGPLVTAPPPPNASAAFEASLEVQKDLLSFLIGATMQIQHAIWWRSAMEEDELQLK